MTPSPRACHDPRSKAYTHPPLPKAVFQVRRTGPWTADQREGIGHGRVGLVIGKPLAILPFEYGTEGM